MNLGNMYEHVYSALFTFSLKRWHGDDYMASWFTACTLAGAVMMNYVLAGFVLVSVYGTLPEWGIIPALSPIVAIFLANYVAFIRDDRYQIVTERFMNQPVGRRAWITVLGWFYIVVSYATPMIFAFVMAGPNLCFDQSTSQHIIKAVVCRVIAVVSG